MFFSDESSFRLGASDDLILIRRRPVSKCCLAALSPIEYEWDIIGPQLQYHIQQESDALLSTDQLQQACNSISQTDIWLLNIIIHARLHGVSVLPLQFLPHRLAYLRVWEE
ncbi:hypothetical protein TNCV_4458201 [Trichonephila clavipes]|nr:hypothetical protein TNCV_4458201 [Trichonephila clavipes]